MRYETFVISSRDSSYKYTAQGVKLRLSSATTEKVADSESGISRTFYADGRTFYANVR